MLIAQIYLLLLLGFCHLQKTFSNQWRPKLNQRNSLYASLNASGIYLTTFYMYLWLGLLYSPMSLCFLINSLVRMSLPTLIVAGSHFLYKCTQLCLFCSVADLFFFFLYAPHICTQTHESVGVSRNAKEDCKGWHLPRKILTIRALKQTHDWRLAGVSGKLKHTSWALRQACGKFAERFVLNLSQKLKT